MGNWRCFPRYKGLMRPGSEQSNLPGRVSKGEHGTEVRTEPVLLTLMGLCKEGLKWSFQGL